MHSGVLEIRNKQNSKKLHSAISTKLIQARGDSGSRFIDESDVTFVTTCTVCGEVVYTVVSTWSWSEVLYRMSFISCVFRILW